MRCVWSSDCWSCAWCCTVDFVQLVLDICVDFSALSFVFKSSMFLHWARLLHPSCWSYLDLLCSVLIFSWSSYWSSLCPEKLKCCPCMFWSSLLCLVFIVLSYFSLLWHGLHGFISKEDQRLSNNNNTKLEFGGLENNWYTLSSIRTMSIEKGNLEPYKLGLSHNWLTFATMVHVSLEGSIWTDRRFWQPSEQQLFQNYGIFFKGWNDGGEESHKGVYIDENN